MEHKKPFDQLEDPHKKAQDAIDHALRLSSVSAAGEVVQVGVRPADPRLSMSWKELPKDQWMRKHYEWAIGECEDMLALAKKNASDMSPHMWEEKIASLKN